ncbi:vWA domain-containing protein [Halorhabdus salina]|uniref:vWA domain-containing protein n=1 Tax=Halorhabdus salina TaxID=2750670 RepID=UPI0015EF3E99|nr:vWA domain-containing protein [Halorhabdus salina]
MRALAAFDDSDESEPVQRIARMVVRADNASARQVIEDAEDTLAKTEEQLGHGTQQSVQSHLDNARRQLDRAERLRERAANSESEKCIRTTAKAVRTYGIATNQALVALEQLDRETSPTVTLTRRADPIRNGSMTAQYTLVGRVVDPTGLDGVNLTATINDDQTVPIRLRGGYANASFATTINLTERVNTIDVTVVERSDTQSKRGNGKRKQKGKDKQKKKNKQKDKQKNKDKPKQSGNAGDQSGQGQKTQTSAVVLKLDGDGLPDTYEENVTKTDPLDPDSDSTLVSGDQGGDGIIDSEHDFDGDSVDNRIEYWFGTDPLSPDTDGDGLEDGFEIRYSETSPQQSDSDDDGVIDAEEDPDGDGVVNQREQKLGTDPHRADSDSDQLSDSREQELGTNATDPDTDADGLEDGVEPEFGTDPLDPDTDDDGVLDGNETYTTNSNNESLGVSVRVTATGSTGKSLTIKENTEARFNNAFASNLTAAPVVDLDTDESIENATVSISYDESALSVNESELVGVRYNESIQGFEPLPTTIDEANDTVHARTDHFSTFTVFKVPNWQTMLRAQEPSNGGQGDPDTAEIDVMLVIDSSGSMSWNDPQEFRKAAAKEFVGALIEGDRAGVVDFDYDAAVPQKLTTDFGSVNVTIDSLDASGGTNIGAGLQRANDHFAANSNDSRSQYTILLTDGQGSGEISQANTAADRGTTIYTIGFGNANGDKLQQIADITSGGYSSVDDASDLPDVFSRVAEDIEPTHSGDDGFSDSLENNGIPISPFMVGDLDNAEANLSANNIAVVHTNPEQNDTDGDTLHDDEEIGSEIDRTIEFFGNEYDIRYYTVKSDPTDPNSDDTGLNDSEEVEKGSDPMEEETLAAGYTLPVLTRTSTPKNQPTTVNTLIHEEEDWTRNPNYKGITDDHLVLVPDEVETKASGDVQEIKFPVIVSYNPNDGAMDYLENTDSQATFRLLDRKPAGIMKTPKNEILEGPKSITLEPGETKELEYRIAAKHTAGFGLKNLINLKRFKFRVEELDSTPFYRPAKDNSNGVFNTETGYNYAGAPILESTQIMLNDVNQILSTGFSVAGSTNAGMMVV